jgi:sulfide:quinone oxidoreductase
MADRRHNIVILGAGFAGLTLASELDGLAASGRADVTLIEGAPHFQMGLSAQWALAGRRSPDEGRRPYELLRARNVRQVREPANAINTAARVVKTGRGEYPYDTLVIATGAGPSPQSVPGLLGAAHDLCNVGEVMRMKEELEHIRSGTVTILVAAVPFKCPPAPYEYALLADEILTERGVRERCPVVVATPEPQPMPVAGKAVGEAVVALLEARRIVCRFQHKVKEVRPEVKSIVFDNGSTLEYSVLAAMPPLRAPEVVRAAGLVDGSGFVPVDLNTMETKTPGVFAVGDVAALTLPDGRTHPKAGVFAEAQALVVAAAIHAKLAGGAPAAYRGRGACFVDVGHGEAAPAEIDLLGPGGPKATIGKPSKDGLAAKRAFEAERLARWFR